MACANRTVVLSTDLLGFLPVPILLKARQVCHFIQQHAEQAMQRLRSVCICDQRDTEVLMFSTTWPVPEAETDAFRAQAAKVQFTRQWARGVVTMLQYTWNLRAFELCILWHDSHVSHADVKAVLDALARSCQRLCSLSLQLPSEEVFRASYLFSLVPRITCLGVAPISAFSLGCILGMYEALGCLQHLESLTVDTNNYSVEDYEQLAWYLSQCGGLRCLSQIDCEDQNWEERARPLMQLQPPNKLKRQVGEGGIKGLLWAEDGGCRVGFCPSLHEI